VLRLTTQLDARTYEQATTAAQRWVLGELADVHLVDQAAAPIRLVVESADARSKRWAVGTKEAAALLGMTPSRLRQLEETPGFPEPVPGVDAAGGRLLRRDEVETFKRTRTPGKPGRPRATSTTPYP
jgi:hypothetical protein